MIALLSFILGAMIGSFLNVCIYRLPREESIVWPGSHCPRCGKFLPFYDNIPLVSYALLLGRCRVCRAPISIQYPIVEAVTALGSFLLFLRFGPSPAYLIYLAFVSALIAVTVIDLYHQIIPDVISLPGIGVGLLASTVLPGRSIIDSLLGAALGAGILAGLRKLWEVLRKVDAMGLGDVKLLAMIGAFLGWKSVLLTVMLSAFFGSVSGLLVMVLQKKGLNQEIPYGPFLALGAVLSLGWGEALIAWYLGHLSP
jgi:leader peptidase (prepilin peptidase)/N-methyltransferase